MSLSQSNSYGQTIIIGGCINICDKNNNVLINNSNSDEVKCPFCQRCILTIEFSFMIKTALFQKYPASQNYYYTKDINDILSNQRSQSQIIFKDLNCIDEEEEYLKRFYAKHEIKNKIVLLTEYYKYHKDIPRLFMLPATKPLNYYHDKKRRLEYIKITKMLQNEENQDQDHIDHVYQNKKFQAFNLEDRILDELSSQKFSQTQISNNNSQTIVEINKKLHEIGQNYSDSLISQNFSQQDQDQSIGNLKNFLKYIHINESDSKQTLQNQQTLKLQSQKQPQLLSHNISTHQKQQNQNIIHISNNNNNINENNNKAQNANKKDKSKENNIITHNNDINNNNNSSQYDKQNDIFSIAYKNSQQNIQQSNQINQKQQKTSMNQLTQQTQSQNKNSINSFQIIKQLIENSIKQQKLKEKASFYINNQENKNYLQIQKSAFSQQTQEILHDDKLKISNQNNKKNILINEKIPLQNKKDQNLPDQNDQLKYQKKFTSKEDTPDRKINQIEKSQHQINSAQSPNKTKSKSKSKKLSTQNCQSNIENVGTIFIKNSEDSSKERKLQKQKQILDSQQKNPSSKKHMKRSLSDRNNSQLKKQLDSNLQKSKYKTFRENKQKHYSQFSSSNLTLTHNKAQSQSVLQSIQLNKIDNNKQQIQQSNTQSKSRSPPPKNKNQLNLQNNSNNNIKQQQQIQEQDIKQQQRLLLQKQFQNLQNLVNKNKEKFKNQHFDNNNFKQQRAEIISQKENINDLNEQNFNKSMKCQIDYKNTQLQTNIKHIQSNLDAQEMFLKTHQQQIQKDLFTDHSTYSIMNTNINTMNNQQQVNLQDQLQPNNQNNTNPSQQLDFSQSQQIQSKQKNNFTNQTRASKVEIENNIKINNSENLKNNLVYDAQNLQKILTQKDKKRQIEEENQKIQNQLLKDQLIKKLLQSNINKQKQKSSISQNNTQVFHNKKNTTTSTQLFTNQSNNTIMNSKAISTINHSRVNSQQIFKQNSVCNTIKNSYITNVSKERRSSSRNSISIDNQIKKAVYQKENIKSQINNEQTDISEKQKQKRNNCFNLIQRDEKLSNSGRQSSSISKKQQYSHKHTKSSIDSQQLQTNMMASLSKLFKNSTQKNIFYQSSPPKALFQNFNLYKL